VIGLTSVNVCSQPGIESGDTKADEPKLSGSTIRNMIPCTAPAVRARMPTNTDAQQKHSAKATASRQASSTSGALVVARNPMT